MVQIVFWIFVGALLIFSSSPAANAQPASGAVQQHPQIVAGHVKFRAYRVFILFFEENTAQELAIYPDLTAREDELWRFGSEGSN